MDVLRQRSAIETATASRERALLVLVLRHLLDRGYIESFERLQLEANLSLGKVRGSNHARF
jgi:hypothetical protein